METLDAQKAYVAHARNELTEHIVYHKLALRERKPENRDLLERLSRQERGHYEFWRSLVPGSDPQPHSLGIIGIPLLRTIFGVTFVTKLLEVNEENAVKVYEAMRPSIPASHRENLERIIEDERSHEAALIGELKEKRVSYIGFIALGLADAIVEITGVHAGFLGVTGSTLVAGIAGVIVGFSAAISMGSAAYLQAKQDPDKSPLLSAFTTGVSYICSVVLLALPYFLITTMLAAFIISTTVGALLLAGFTFYGAILFNRKFWGEFAESMALMLGTAFASYILGLIVGRISHVGQQF